MSPAQPYKPFAGIGSRETPEDVMELFETLAERLAREGWTLRSGCAPGADSAFERGATKVRVLPPELYLPWPGFEDRRDVYRGRERPQEQAYLIAAEHHPAWERLSQGGRALHARNCHQMLGPDVTQPVLSRFVVCWTKGGKGKGGTGQALRLAAHYGVEIIDAGSEAGLERIRAFAHG